MTSPPPIPRPSIASAKVAQLNRYTPHAADFATRDVLGHKWPYLPEAIRDPSVHGLLPTTDAVIVLIQLAKDPGADRSVNEISVLPQDFKMDDLLIGLSFPESRARESSC